jgi:hypothetical protein
MAKRRSAPDPSHKYILLGKWLMRTEAWRDLDSVARCTYIELSSRYGGPGSNNGRIPCSLRELASALHVSKATAMRALARLRDHGFVVMTKQGHFDFKKKHAAEFRLTEFACDVTGEFATKDFTHWKKQNPVLPENPAGFRDDTALVSS